MFFNPPPMVRAMDSFGNINTVGLFDIGRRRWPEDTELFHMALQHRRSDVPLQNLNEWYAPFYDRNFSQDLADEQFSR